MLKRLITGIVYIGIIVGFFFLRHVHTSLFGILVYAFSIIGTLEMIQAFAHKSAQPDGSLAPKVAMTNAQKSAVMTYAVFFAPDRKSTRLNSIHSRASRMPSSA